MVLDHLVLRSPHRESLLADLTNRFQLSASEGFRDGDVVHSKGVRFGNGPFLDFFNWPKDKSYFVPLLALEGGLAKAQQVAVRYGWNTKLHSRSDIPATERPPWSTLSFRRGQGLISSVFVIEYEDEPEAWLIDQYRGALYNRNTTGDVSVELSSVVVHCDDIWNARSQLETLAGGPMPIIDLHPLNEHGPGVGALRIRQSDNSLAQWAPTTIDRF